MDIRVLAQKWELAQASIPIRQGGQILEECHHLLAFERTGEQAVPLVIDGMYLKNALCQVEADTSNVHGGLLSSVDCCLTLPVWHLDAVRREESIPLPLVGWGGLPTCRLAGAG